MDIKQETAITGAERDLMIDALAQLTWDLPSGGNTSQAPLNLSIGKSDGSQAATPAEQMLMPIENGQLPDTAKDALREALEVTVCTLMIYVLVNPSVCTSAYAYGDSTRALSVPHHC